MVMSTINVVVKSDINNRGVIRLNEKEYVFEDTAYSVTYFVEEYGNTIHILYLNKQYMGTLAKIKILDGMGIEILGKYVIHPSMTKYLDFVRIGKNFIIGYTDAHNCGYMALVDMETYIIKQISVIETEVSNIRMTTIKDGLMMSFNKYKLNKTLLLYVTLEEETLKIQDTKDLGFYFSGSLIHRVLDENSIEIEYTKDFDGIDIAVKRVLVQNNKMVLI